MKVIIDDKIPYIREAMKQLPFEAVFVPSSAINSSLVEDAHALIIRTRTRCDEKLLHNSKVEFIATATIGFDHIDTDYCNKAGISWTNAPGCNSGSVAQYLHSSLLLLEQEKGLRLSEATLGIVGVGNVGKKVARVAQELGMRVLLNDPPREAAEANPSFHPLVSIAESCDVITFHVPLNREGPYKTFHMADEAFFSSLKRKPYLINTSRGEVVKTEALLHALNEGMVSDAIIDVWEEEPDINLTLLNKVYIGTPHIAGYSADGKANATRMALDALCQHFHIEGSYTIQPPQPQLTLSAQGNPFLQIYNPLEDSRLLKQTPEKFEWFRGNYPLRREREAYGI